MKKYRVTKNNSDIECGRLFDSLDDAIKFFCIVYLHDYPYSNIMDLAPVVRSAFEDASVVSFVSGNYIYSIKSIDFSSRGDIESYLIHREPRSDSNMSFNERLQMEFEN